MQPHTTLKGNLTAATATTFALLFLNAIPSMAFSFTNPRSLNANELLADQSIFQLQTPWGLSGTLNGTASFTRPVTWTKPLFDPRTANATGSRTFISATATSYEQQFAGKFEDAPVFPFPSAVDASWEDFNLYDISNGVITPQWGQVPGWKTITGANEQFTQVWNLTKTSLAPGELNCPTQYNGKDVTGCPVVETWWGGALDIKAGASLEGSIANTIIGDELTSLTLQLDRDLDYKIDSSTDRIASIKSGVYELKLRDSGGLQDINIKFNATINGKQAQLQVSGDTVWKQSGVEIETANPSYQFQVGTEKYLTQGVRSQYTENLVDFPTMRLGILMSNGTGATASAFIGAFNPLSDRKAVIKIETVPEPLTLIASGLAIGFGALSQREYSKKRQQK
ncbi:MAG: PEP-CTERM sorting domain-containing protein [Microcystis sp. LE19-338.1B]|jgi:hypothetical protein|nr:PEP-CTERM sorting domain-containing protein [Microcystis sp. LE19-338.1B]MCZ8359025.1 PEP-CTERM sorting domain-containing protein [Microcystis sp. LE19-388.1G]